MILVTGGTGLVGCHLLYLLVNKNKKIKALHRKNSKIDVVKKVFSYHSDSFEELFQKFNGLKEILMILKVFQKLLKMLQRFIIVLHLSLLIQKI